MGGKIIKIAAVAVSVVLLAVSCSVSPEKEEELAPPIKAPANVEYVTEPVKLGNISNSIKASCTVVSQTQASLSFTQRGGYLKKIEVGLGQNVEAGQVLATLDTDSLEKEIKTKTLEIEKIKMELDSIDNGSTQLDIDRKNLRLAYLKRSYQISGNSDPELQYQIEDLKLEIRQLQQQQNADMGAAIKKKDLQIAQIQLEDLQLTMEKSTITAPNAGKVVFIEEVATGEFIAALKTLIKVANPNDLVLEYKGTSANKLKIGMPATVTIKGAVCAGEVVMTPSEVPIEELELKKDTVLIKVAELPAETALGEFGDFEVVIEQKENVIVVPKRAVVQSIGSYYARVLVDGIRNERSIEVGIASLNEYEVISGLKEGEILILE